MPSVGQNAGTNNPWPIPRIWPDSTVWVLGSGPSLDSIKPYSKIMINKNVIAVHYSFRIGPFVDALFMGDARCYWQIPDEIDKFEGLKVSTNIHTIKHKSIDGIKNIHIINLSKKKSGLSNISSEVCYNNSSGGAAINLAFLLGAKRIILLGYDMKTVDGVHNWHTYHKYSPDKDIYQKRFLEAFPHIHRELLALGVECYNTTEDSALLEFPFVTIEETLLW